MPAKYEVKVGEDRYGNIELKFNFQNAIMPRKAWRYLLKVGNFEYWLTSKAWIGKPTDENRYAIEKIKQVLAEPDSLFVKRDKYDTATASKK